MSPGFTEIIRRHCHPMAPQRTETEAVLNPIPGIRAVLFDIYGTLLVSGAGDITLQTGTSSDDAFRAALVACGVPPDAVAPLSADLLQEAIAEHHVAARSRGIEFPEVDIVAVWRDVFTKITAVAELPDETRVSVDLDRLALEYEVRTNAVWPMPDTGDCLSELRGRGLSLGIISNAQAMTPELFPALLGQNLAELGFQSDLQFFSYRYGESKPGRTLFEAAITALRQQGIEPQEAVFIGNDMLKDVWAAAQLGFRTILFAGDARSLRLRPDDPRLRNCRPDAVVTDLRSVCSCLDAV